LKLRYAIACALVFFLFVAAVDTIPDPPAVFRHSAANGNVTIVHVRGSSTHQQTILTPFDSSRFIRTAASASRLTIENRVLGSYHVLLVRHSADTSPPALS
jgi:hypothetical protein